MWASYSNNIIVFLTAGLSRLRMKSSIRSVVKTILNLVGIPGNTRGGVLFESSYKKRGNIETRPKLNNGVTRKKYDNYTINKL